MAEGKRSQVVLLDERKLDIVILPKLYAGELLDIVASHFNLKEKEYFGLAFLDETGHYSWLQLDRRVLEHELCKKSPLVFYFLVKYFVESIAQLKDSATVEAFFLQAKLLVFKGTVEVESEPAFHLAALVLQATHGDYVDEQTTRSHLKKLPVLPTSTLKEHLSLSVCEDKVIEHYKKLEGQSRGTCIVNYMTIVESLPTYGVHFYKVKDKGGIPWWLGLSHRGVSQYDHTDRKVPRKVFLWKQLENLYFRDRKFSIEVHDPRRVSVSRRTFGPGNVTVYVWIAATPSLTRSIWSMAIGQHQFYLDHKHCKSQIGAVRPLGQIASELSRSVQSLSSASSASNLSRSASTHSLPTLKIEDEQSEEASLVRHEMLMVLKVRKEALEEALQKKIEELKALCIKEGEIIGELPPEIPICPGEPPPQVRRRVGTAFVLNDQLITRAKSKEEEALSKLELEYEIQSKIASAALKLANDLSSKKNVRKQRKVCCQQAQAKLKDIEQKLATTRKQAEVAHKKAEGLKQKLTPKSSDDEFSEDESSRSTDGSEHMYNESGVNLSDLCTPTSPCGLKVDDENCRTNRLVLRISPAESPVPTSSSSSSSLHQLSIKNESSSGQLTRSKSCGLAVHHGKDYPESLPPSPVPSIQRLRVPGMIYDSLAVCVPGNTFPTKPSYHSPQYSTLATRSHSTYSASSDYDSISLGSGSALSLKSPYRNRFESTLNIEGSNLYSVSTQRTSQAFDSQDDLLAVTSADAPDLGLISRHNSLESRKRHSQHRPSPTHTSATGNSLSPHWHGASTLPISSSFDERLSFAARAATLDHPRRQRVAHNHHHQQRCAEHPAVPHPHHSWHVPCRPDSRSLDDLEPSKHEFRAFDNHLSREAVCHSPSHDEVDMPLQPPLRYFQQLHVSEPALNTAGHWPQSSPSKECIAERHSDAIPESMVMDCMEGSVEFARPDALHVSSTSRRYGWQRHNATSPSIYASPSMLFSPTLKTKPKGWVETSLDSPLPPRRSKTKGRRPSRHSSPEEYSPAVDVSGMTSRLADVGERSFYQIESDARDQVSQGPQLSGAIAGPQATAKPCIQRVLSPSPANFTYPSGVEINIVSVGHFQPYWEETKPYEISDFYKYSTKHRRQGLCQKSSVAANQVHRDESNVSSCRTDHNIYETKPVPPDSTEREREMNLGWSNSHLHSQYSLAAPQFGTHIENLSSHAQPERGVSPVPHLPRNISFGEPPGPMSVATAFHDEMLSWYEDRGTVKKATLV